MNNSPPSPSTSPTDHIISKQFARFLSFCVRRGARSLTGARSLWVGCQPEAKQRIYFANHNSHIDFILLWSSLPKDIRQKTRPVAASDYWLKDGFRRFLIQDTFSGITIARNAAGASDPLIAIKEALDQGDSIIFFPEGTRNLSDDTELLDFKSGLYHLSQQYPDVEFVPVWISNLKRVMPKGVLMPLPLLSTVIFGEPLQRNPDWNKAEFLSDAKQRLLDLKGHELK
ncbi:lysophospholipid acyltransferase family protein [Acinetobacter rudis]|uniref:Lysophospholipid acyltransferase family protein n=1 Tax=Acinetobacter rudis TaxID=632955 RepID=A0AAW8J624_9GAMM|nr:lysophospholipid acyltransferase family protein [Acinetobacter rudis]MDQ8935149.1 lysophospholipid acyltransferase family protein [Acinetobacter rudis]MDQ8953012.1 lysophospholipid acyltransferase family protein [Acinetobacter rudis]MDQ9017017.1 lysophospholipid acyltransferase family protein [Acinetobacter rudis]